MESSIICIPSSDSKERKYIPIDEILTQNKIQYPKKLIKAIVSKWKTIFNTVLHKNKTARIIQASINTNEYFINCRNVKFGHICFVYDRQTKIFNLMVSPVLYQDFLCNINKGYKMIIKVSNTSLTKLFLDFFDHINKIFFCEECGNYVLNTSYYEELEKCETCVFETICSSQKTQEEPCAICLETTKHWFTTKCGHKFHRK